MPADGVASGWLDSSAAAWVVSPGAARWMARLRVVTWPLAGGSSHGGEVLSDAITDCEWKRSAH
jgi:hypothetical protein